jgi:Leucine-rich repeat (LRR) protein
LTKLKTLSFQNNSITTIDSQTFSGLTSLEFLILSKSKIEKIEKDSFENLPSLRYIYLLNTPMSSDPDKKMDIIRAYPRINFVA